ncbi:NADPH-dependent F420 reductase [Comamonas flocculans]|uniref:Diguanylate cyclase n=1 Tax=Comamonas flocculans TaxID=2597701 RepID=A0A5B8RWJ4_9BURK|nr:NAD(P)-binding domain-containing protein [Comamonas flocculans]QEA13453.1 diguanylate cyclase [Comamonas flocculans]
MTSISIIGRGKMGSAIAGIAQRAGAQIQLVNRSATPADDRPDTTHAVLGEDLTGDIVVLAVPHGAYPNILKHYRDRLGGKVVIDISNPMDFTTYEQPEALRNTSTALELARELPEDVAVLKAFNVNLADTLKTRTNGMTATTVLFAGDDAAGKLALTELLQAAGLRAVDVGPLPRSVQLEAMGYLQIVLASSGKTRFESGFSLLP